MYVLTNVHINGDSLRATISLGTWCIKPNNAHFYLLFVSPTFMFDSFAYFRVCIIATENHVVLYTYEGLSKNYVDFYHNSITVQANIFKFQLTLNLFKSNRFLKFG